MNYQVLDTIETPNYREIEILMDENGKMHYAMMICRGDLIRGNKMLPVYNQPQAQVIFVDYMPSLLLADANRGDEIGGYEMKYDIALYTNAEYSRKLNGYTATPLNA